MLKSKKLEFLRYLVSGGSTYLVYVGFLYVGMNVFEFSSSLVFFVSFLCANIYNYLAHYFFTFFSSRDHVISLARFSMIVLVGLLGGYLFGYAGSYVLPDCEFWFSALYGALWPLISYFLLKRVFS